MCRNEKVFRRIVQHKEKELADLGTRFYDTLAEEMARRYCYQNEMMEELRGSLWRI